MERYAEDLPIELWIKVFDYLSIHDIFQSFSNLNKYFNDILTSTHFLFKVELKVEENDNIEHLPNLYTSNTVLNRIISLKSFSYDFFPEFYQNRGEQLIRLQSLLIKANSRDIPSICLALQQLNTLEYLSLSCIPNQNLLENILTSRSLRKCRLHFWRVITPINDHLDANSPIETLYLKLNDDKNHSVVNLLLSHMPNLKKLEISKENLISHPLPNLETLKLLWGYYSIQSNCLQYLPTITPNLKHLSLSIFYKTLNDHLINHLCLILKQMKQVKISILCRQLTKPTENNTEKIFHNYCQRIASAIRSQSNACFDIKWFEKNPKTHKIEINFTNV